jgi:hypothetical protein
MYDKSSDNSGPTYQPVPLRDFRYLVRFTTPITTTDPVTKKSSPVQTDICKDYCAIKPVGTQYFYQNINPSQNATQKEYNAEADLTHEAYLRWRPDAHTFDQLVQKQKLSGQTIITTYQVLRSTDWMGMPFYTRLDLRVLSREII